MRELVLRLAFQIADGIQSDKDIFIEEGQNIFGEEVNTHVSPDIDFSGSFAATGQRCLISLSPSNMLRNYSQFSSIARRHIPLVLHVNARPFQNSRYGSLHNYEHIHALSRAGWFQLIARSPWEEICLVLAAFRIAENSLIPGMVISDYDPVEFSGNLPDEDKISTFLGSRKDIIESVTPAQKILFGNDRRRIPKWMDIDQPVMLGSHKSEEAFNFEDAASKKYFYDHLEEIMKDVFEEIYNFFGFEFRAVSNKGRRTKYALVTTDNKPVQLYEQSKYRSKFDFIRINQLLPFPVEDLRNAINEKKGVVIFDHDLATRSESSYILRAIKAVQANKQNIHINYLGHQLDEMMFDNALKAIVENGQRDPKFLSVQFTRESSSSPQHQILLEEIKSNYPGIMDAGIPAKYKEAERADFIERIPVALKRYQDNGPPYSSLSRFFNDYVHFRTHGEREEIIADPFSALPVIPALSAGLKQLKQGEKTLPAINFETCTACGNCFSYCPHNALHPALLNIESLFSEGIIILQKRGVQILSIQPYLKPLSKYIANKLRNVHGGILDEMLYPVIDSFIQKLDLASDKSTKLLEDFKQVLGVYGSAAFSVSDIMFRQPNTIERGSGSLFSIFMNTVSCTSCGLCAELCPESSIELAVFGKEAIEKTDISFETWQNLSGTLGDEILRLYENESYSKISALNLSRNYAMTMIGSSKEDGPMPHKSMTKIIMAAIEATVQPKLVELIKHLEGIKLKLSEDIQLAMQEALPTRNFDGISQFLDATEEKQLSLTEILNSGSSPYDEGLVDTISLRNKIELHTEIKSLIEKVSSGTTGVGRSRAAMVIAGKDRMAWAKAFPYNHFANPVWIHWDGNAPDQSLGLMKGMIRECMEDIRLIRMASLENQGKTSEADTQGLRNFRWESMSKEERNICPPVILIAEKNDFLQAGWQSLNTILSQDYPVKVIMLDDLTSSDNNIQNQISQNFSWLFSTISLRNSFVYQGSLADPGDLCTGLMEGFERSYPALFILYATDMEKHDFPGRNWLDLARLARDSRAFPNLKYDPSNRIHFLKGAIDISANRNTKNTWVREMVNPENKESGYIEWTWADWAFNQKAWKKYFVTVEKNANQLDLAKFLQLDSEGQKGKVAVLYRSSPKGLKIYKIGEEIIRISKTVKDQWNGLQELAGEIIEFPEKLRQEIQTELEQSYAAKLKKAEDEFTTKVQQIEESQLEDIRLRVRNKLVELTKLAPE